jgi:hypothetical protein
LQEGIDEGALTAAPAVAGIEIVAVDALYKPSKPRWQFQKTQPGALCLP